MNVNLFPFAVLWMALAAVVVGLIAFRAWITRREDDSLHLRQAELSIVSEQATMARILDVVDRWGQALTVAALLFGLVIGAAYLYQAFLRNGLS